MLRWSVSLVNYGRNGWNLPNWIRIEICGVVLGEIGTLRIAAIGWFLNNTDFIGFSHLTLLLLIVLIILKTINVEVVLVMVNIVLIWNEIVLLSRCFEKLPERLCFHLKLGRDLSIFPIFDSFWLVERVDRSGRKLFIYRNCFLNLLIEHRTLISSRLNGLIPLLFFALSLFLQRLLYATQSYQICPFSLGWLFSEILGQSLRFWGFGWYSIWYVGASSIYISASFQSFLAVICLQACNLRL